MDGNRRGGKKGKVCIDVENFLNLRSMDGKGERGKIIRRGRCGSLISCG